MSEFKFFDRPFFPPPDGYALAVTVGKWAKPDGFALRNPNGRVWMARLCFGWVSLLFFARDLEMLILDLQANLRETHDAAEALATTLRDEHPETYRRFFQLVEHPNAD